jgi:hypothetical protein
MNYIKEISIHIKTNAKQGRQTESESGATTSTNDGYTLLTYSMIYQPPPPADPSNPVKPKTQKGTHNDKPYFTNYIEYTGSLKSYLLSRGYDEILLFFFNKEHFQTVLSNIGIEINPSIRIDRMNEYSSKNIKVMLDLLFPTSFPSLNNSITSYNQLFEESSGFTPSSITYYLPGVLKNFGVAPNRYSYLKIGENIHTVYRIVLINDVMNHPKFKFLIKTANRFFKKFRTEREDVIKGLVTRFMAIESVLHDIESDLQVEYTKKRGNNTENPAKFKYSGLNTMINSLGVFKPGNERIFKPGAKSELRGVFLNDSNEPLFDRLKKALEEILPVSSNNREQIKKFLVYYEIFTKYYQYDNDYPADNKQPPVLKYIYYSKTTDNDRNDDFDSYGRRNYSLFDIEKEAKKQMQSDNIMAEYRALFDAFKAISFDRVLTDNNKFNEIIKSYVNDLDTPDNFLIYLFNILSLMKTKDGSIPNVFSKYKNIADKINANSIPDYCKITVVNSFEKDKTADGEKTANHEVYIHLDLIDGEVNDANLSSIKCKYRGKHLGAMYQRHTKPYEFWTIRSLPFFHVRGMLEKEAKNTDVGKPLQGGGRKTRCRRVIHRIRKTRRR